MASCSLVKVVRYLMLHIRLYLILVAYIFRARGLIYMHSQDVGDQEQGATFRMLVTEYSTSAPRE